MCVTAAGLSLWLDNGPANKTAAMANVSGIATDTAKAIVAQLNGEAPSDQAAAAAVDKALKR